MTIKRSDSGRDYAQEYRDTLAYLTGNWSLLPQIRRLALQSRLNALARAIRWRNINERSAAGVGVRRETGSAKKEPF